MANEDQFDFKASERELSPEDVAGMLSEETRQLVGAFTENPSAALPSFALAGIERQLAELGIISLKPLDEHRQEAWDRADWDEVELHDRLRELFGSDKHDTHTEWTPLGLEVSKVCARISPRPEQPELTEEEQADVKRDIAERVREMEESDPGFIAFLREVGAIE